MESEDEKKARMTEAALEALGKAQVRRKAERVIKRRGPDFEAQIKAEARVEVLKEIEDSGGDLPDIFEVMRELGGKRWILERIREAPPGSKDVMLLIKQFFDRKEGQAQRRGQSDTGGAERRIKDMMDGFLPVKAEDGDCESESGEVGIEGSPGAPSEPGVPAEGSPGA
jgi:hypothetical protein